MWNGSNNISTAYSGTYLSTASYPMSMSPGWRVGDPYKPVGEEVEFTKEKKKTLWETLQQLL